MTDWLLDRPTKMDQPKSPASIIVAAIINGDVATCRLKNRTDDDEEGKQGV